jgi:diguanylate cyclase (GGDEF)-like protein
MSGFKSGLLQRLGQHISPILFGPPILAFAPALSLGAFWLGGEPALILTSLGLPLLYAAAGVGRSKGPADRRDKLTGLILKEEFDEGLETVNQRCIGVGLKSACFVVQLDDYQNILDRHGEAAADQVVARTSERILSVLRSNDLVTRSGPHKFGICLNAGQNLDLELCIQLAGRLQAAIEDPIILDGTALNVSCCIGFCLHSRAPSKLAHDWEDAATIALSDAQKVGPSSIRAFSSAMRQKTRTRKDLAAEAAGALEAGQIQPWFQPQISTDTGRVTGFEALARWIHPVHGEILPGTFLPVIENLGLSERLCQAMLFHALTALKAWDTAGCHVPRVAVNFATEDLRNPGLVDKIRWELDRFDLTPDRLAVEILETVVATGADDTVTRNILGLGELGCRIDLDDFGTGHAAIGAIRRFNITRIKIDRSFVIKADRDPEQQKLISAILTMADRLDLETLAEGVETIGEHALLAQLGCDHVQGFGIGKPMPFEQTLDWVAAHEAKILTPPRIGGRAG